MNLINPDNTITDVKRAVLSDSQNKIRLNANGGNSILIVCEPKREIEYINSINKLLTNDLFRIIDVNKILMDFIEKNFDNIDEYFNLLQTSPEQIFKASENEDREDLYKLIMDEIKKTYNESKIPVLIRTGTLYSTGIDNIHIMEHQMVTGANKPLIVLYPATKDNGKLLFLNTRPASKYRCIVIE